MAIIMGAATVPAGTTGTLVFTTSPYCNVTFYNVSSNTVWIGTSTAVTSANGMQCHSIPTNFFTYVGSKAASFYATTGATNATSVATLNYIISTNG
jgi:hypothetical protein